MASRARTIIAVCVVLGLFAAVFVYASGSDNSGLGEGESTSTLPAGTRIVFFGDSITAAGLLPGGYVELVREAVGATEDSSVEVIGSGVVGDDVRDLQERLSRDVLSLDPTLVVIYVGVNDVASVSPGSEEAGLATYRSGLADLIDRIQSTGSAVLVCTPGLLGERPYEQDRENLLLDRYAEVVRAVAAERDAAVCDLRRAFTEYLSSNNPEDRSRGVLTIDGIHLNSAGNRFVAQRMVQYLEDMDY